MKVAILDDELHCVESLVLHLQSLLPEITVVYKSTNPVEALSKLQEIEFDLLFLDIEMPVMNGFELLNSMEEVRFDVIFTTAYSQYAVEAFRAQAINYLLKPIDEDELRSALLTYMANKEISIRTPENLEELLNNFIIGKSLIDKIAIPVSDGIEFIDVADIVYCQSHSNYTSIHLANNKTLMFSRTLKDTEDILNKYGYLRIHQSYLINPGHLKKYVRHDGGSVIMSDDTKIPISASKRNNIMSYLESLRT
ncbi:MAG TPA: LytTR family DNA-binding domain-containing protein [Flavobacteriaceae bacterium]|nr:LytTR family DNA-binding domain-containing protein [Flavobacteriaceae bacterium]